MSSAPTMVSLAADACLDRSLGHGGVASGGRGRRAYAKTENLPKRMRQAIESSRQQESKQAEKLAAAAKVKYLQTVQQMERGELDWM
jgi:hypothetical protein